FVNNDDDGFSISNYPFFSNNNNNAILFNFIMVNPDFNLEFNKPNDSFSFGNFFDVLIEDYILNININCAALIKTELIYSVQNLLKSFNNNNKFRFVLRDYFTIAT
ncbi:hypothetical protein B0H65DRAFT_422950, partial [Neurospora tetraspora]